MKRQLTAQNRVSERDTVDGEPVTATAAAFGYSRPSYYQAADPALKPAGLAGPIEEKFGVSADAGQRHVFVEYFGISHVFHYFTLSISIGRESGI